MCAAALKMKAGPSNGKVYTEEDWNTESGPDKEGGYLYSKVVLLLTKPIIHSQSSSFCLSLLSVLKTLLGAKMLILHMCPLMLFPDLLADNC